MERKERSPLSEVLERLFRIELSLRGIKIGSKLEEESLSEHILEVFVTDAIKDVQHAVETLSSRMEA